MANSVVDIKTNRPSSSADRVSWDLADLYHGVDDPQITKDLESALKLADSFLHSGKANTNGVASRKVENKSETVRSWRTKPLLVSSTRTS